jgi:hypothetical protein
VSMNERAAGLLTHSHPYHWAGFSVVGACGGASGRMDRNRGMQDRATPRRSRASSHVAPLLVLLLLMILAAARLAAAELEAPGFDMVEPPEADRAVQVGPRGTARGSSVQSDGGGTDSFDLAIRDSDES